MAGNKQNEGDRQISHNMLDDVHNTDMIVVSSGEMPEDNGVDDDVAEDEKMVTHL